MSILKVARIGHPVVRTPAKDVPEDAFSDLRNISTGAPALSRPRQSTHPVTSTWPSTSSSP